MPRSLRQLRDHHKERNRPSGFRFAFADRVDLLNTSAWDALTRGGTIFLRRDILRVIEAHGPANLEPRYALICHGDKPVAAMATQLVHITHEQFGRPKAEAGRRRSLLKRALKPLKPASKIVSQRMLVGGNLLSWGFHGVAFAADETAETVWPAVAEALYRIRRADKLIGQTNLVMVKDAGAAETGIEALRRFSYRPVETEPNMVLSVRPEWRTFEDYLAALDGKRRRNVRDIEKKLAAAGCTLESVNGLAADASRIHELYLAVHDRAAIRLVTLPPTYLPAFAAAAGDDFRSTLIRREGRIVGFVTSVKDGDTAVGYYVGFDRAEAESGLPLYLRLLYAAVGDAIHWRCSRLSMGRTALEPKAGLGAKPEAMSIWVRHRVPSVNWLLRGVVGAIPHAEAPERHPFKD